MTAKTTGFASPAQGYEEQSIDLNKLFINNPAATYFLRLKSADMESLGIPQGSLLIVDRSINPTHNSLVLIRHEGQFYCRLMVKQKGRVKFTNGTTDITPTPDDTEIIGVITSSIQEYKK
jgi:DNA polymerase V